MINSNFVLVESPSKVKTIGEILGSDFTVLASKGHVKNLPKHNIGIDFNNNFTPKYEIINRTLIKGLLSKIKDNSKIYLATDNDREGEAIAWHLMEIISKRFKNLIFHRIKFNEITKSAILFAFNSCQNINFNLVNSQQARQIIDRIIGFRLSPLLWSNVQKRISAGRVQSVVLRLVCERDYEIKNFVPKEYWKITGDFLLKINKIDINFCANLEKLNKSKIEINNKISKDIVYNDIISRRKSCNIIKINSKQSIKKPLAPLITSSLQQAMGLKYNFSVNRTMMIAQQLYEGIKIGDELVGIITYMRTDSVNISKDFQSNSMIYIKEIYGVSYIEKKTNIYKNKLTSQNAHEAIRPTKIELTPDSIKKYLSNDQYKVYEVIWNRFVASQMASALIKRTTINICIKTLDHKEYIFKLIASSIKFDGFMCISKVIDNELNNKSYNILNENLDDIEINSDNCNILKLITEQKFTKPLAKYTEFSLVKKMEENGIGRPSTYASMVNVIQKRKYVQKEKGKLSVTALGFKVNDFLIDNVSKLINISFTANMEQKLDEIENGEKVWTAVVNDFYNNFIKWIKIAKYATAPDKNKIRKLFLVMNNIKEWEAPIKQKNKKTVFNDKKFFESILKQYTLNDIITYKQWIYLVKILLKYSNQLQMIEDFIIEYDLREEVKIFDNKFINQSNNDKNNVIE